MKEKVRILIMQKFGKVEGFELINIDTEQIEYSDFSPYPTETAVIRAAEVVCAMFNYELETIK